jgi:transposase-like protein
MTPSRLLKRLIIAEALVQGSSIAAVARHLGASRSWVSREANALETRPSFSALLERRAESIAQRIDDAFTTLDSLKATPVQNTSLGSS